MKRIGCAVLMAFTVVARAGSSPGRVADLMEDINAGYEMIGKALEADRPVSEVEPQIQKLRAMFIKLKASYQPFYRGHESEWANYAERVRAALDETERTWRDNDFVSARAAWALVTATRDEAHAEF